MRIPTALGAWVALAVGLVSLPALAVDDATRATARNLVNAGVADFEAGRYEAATEKLGVAYESVKVPTVALWLARAHVKMGHLVTASELYMQALQLTRNELWVGTAQESAQREARAELEALRPRIPQLRIVLNGAKPEEVEVTVDGVVVPSAFMNLERPADLGQRRIVGKRGTERVEVTVTLEEGDAKDAVLGFSIAESAVGPGGGLAGSQAMPAASIRRAPSSDRPVTSVALEPDQGFISIPDQKLWGWVGVAVGATGVGIGTVTGILVADRYSELKNDCPNRVCEGSSFRDRVDSYDRLRAASTVAFVVGGIGAAAGITLLATAPKGESSGISFWVLPGAAGLEGEL